MSHESLRDIYEFAETELAIMIIKRDIDRSTGLTLAVTQKHRANRNLELISHMAQVIIVRQMQEVALVLLITSGLNDSADFVPKMLSGKTQSFGHHACRKGQCGESRQCGDDAALQNKDMFFL